MRQPVALLTRIQSGQRREHACRPQQHAGTATAVPIASVPTAALWPSSSVAVTPRLPTIRPRVPTAFPTAALWPLAATHADATLLSVSGPAVLRSDDVAPRSASDAGSDAGSDVGNHRPETG